MLDRYKNHSFLINIVAFLAFFLLASERLVAFSSLADLLIDSDRSTVHSLLFNFLRVLTTIIFLGLLPTILSITDSFIIFFTTPIFKKRWKKFTSLKRGYYSFILIVILFGISFFSELLINNRALYVKFQGQTFYDTLYTFKRAKDFGMTGYGLPNYRLLKDFYAEQAEKRNRRFADGTATEEDKKYRSEWGEDFVVLPPYPYGPVESLLDELPGRPPHPPSWLQSAWRINYWDQGWYQLPDANSVLPEKYSAPKWANVPRHDIYKDMALDGNLKFRDGKKPVGAFTHILGTDDRGRDVFSRMVYGFYTSIKFALIVTFICYSIGVSIGAFLGYFGGVFDIIVQRFVEIWSAMPFLYTVMIISAIMEPTFMLLAFILTLFGWMGMTYYIRGEFYREKSKDYVSAATAIGCTHTSIIFKHILPNSLTPVISFMPFAIVGNISSLVSLDFLGFGLPAPTPSWGELLGQGLANLTKPWLVLSPMIAMFVTLLLVSFIGEAIREAFDPKEYSRLR